MWWIMPRYSYFVLIVFGIFQLQLLKFNVSFLVQCPRWTFCQNVAAILKGKKCLFQLACAKIIFQKWVQKSIQFFDERKVELYFEGNTSSCSDKVNKQVQSIHFTPCSHPLQLHQQIMSHRVRCRHLYPGVRGRPY